MIHGSPLPFGLAPLSALARRSSRPHVTPLFNAGIQHLPGRAHPRRLPRRC